MKCVQAALAAAFVVAGVGSTPRTSHALDLETALGQVDAANPSLASHRALVDAARRRVAPAGAWESPMLELGVVNVPATGRFDTDPMTMKMVGLSQRVPVFGANRLARRAGGEAFDAEIAATEAFRYETLGSAWEAYADAYYGSELVRVAETHRDGLKRLVEAARARYAAGKGRLEEVLAGEAEQARLLADLASFQAEEASGRARLGAMRGLDAAPADEELKAPPAVVVPVKADDWLAAVTPTHPQLKQLDAKASGYHLLGRAARRKAWPDLELKGSYGFRERLSPAVSGIAGGETQDNMWSASVELALPIFAGHRPGPEGAEMDALAQAAEAERRAAELDLKQQVSVAWAQAHGAQSAASLLDEVTVAARRRAVDAAWVSYAAGATDLWRVLEVSHSLYADEVALARARRDLVRTEARLVALTGRTDLLGVPLSGAVGDKR